MDKLKKYNFYSYINSKNIGSPTIKKDITFKGESDDNKSVEESLKISSDSSTANALASIAISKKQKTFDHKKLAEEINKKLEQNVEAKDIWKELGISSSLYCKIVKEFNIATPRKKIKQNSKNVNIENFIEDVKNGIPKDKILRKYNISSQQYLKLIKKNQIKSKKMIANEAVKDITQEEFYSAIKSSKSRYEVLKKLGLSSNIKTYNRLKDKFNITEDPINIHEEWASLSAEDLKELSLSGKSIKEICDEYNISTQTLQYAMRVNNITTPAIEARERRFNINKDEIQKDIDSGMSIAEIREKYKLSSAQFQALLDEGKIVSPQKISREKMNSITREQFVEVINSTTNLKEAIEMLGISKGAFYKLEQKFELEAPWKRKSRSIEFPMSKETLEQEISSEKTLEEICSQYNISQYMYYKMLNGYKIKTPKSEIKEVTSKIPTEQIENMIKSNNSHKEVYTELGLTKKQYETLLKRRGIITEHQKKLEISRNIPKEDLLEFVLSGKSLKDICDKYQISISTCLKLLRQNSINWETSTNKHTNSNNNADIIKDNLTNLLIQSAEISNSEPLVELVDYVYEVEINKNNKDAIIDFIKILTNIKNGNISADNAIKRNEIETILKMKESQDNITNTMFDFINLYNQTNNNISEIMLQYIPTSYSDSNYKKAKTIIDIVNNNIEDNTSIEKILTFQDAVWSKNPFVKKAENYATDSIGNIDYEKGGEYIKASKIYLGESEANANIQDMINIIQEENIPEEKAITYIIKLTNLVKDKKLENIRLSYFLEFFDPKDPQSKNIIKTFVENYYITSDTEVLASDEKGKTKPAKICARAKQKIYEKYKFPKGAEVLALFEEAAEHIVPPKGSAGIKFFKRGKEIYPRLKIMGYPDRINSSSTDFIFDEYSDDGGHK